MEKEYEYIIHKHGLESRFHFECCETICLSQDEFNRLLEIFIGRNYNTLDSDYLLTDKLKKLIDPIESKEDRTTTMFAVGYGALPPSLTVVRPKSEPAPFGSLPDQDALEVKSY